MKKKTGFNLRKVCGEYVIVAEGRENIDFSKIINLNESAAFLWERANADGFTVDDLTNLLTNEYEVDAETARHDVEEMLEQWRNAEIVEE